MKWLLAQNLKAKTLEFTRGLWATWCSLKQVKLKSNTVKWASAFLNTKYQIYTGREMARREREREREIERLFKWHCSLMAFGLVKQAYAQTTCPCPSELSESKILAAFERHRRVFPCLSEFCLFWYVTYWYLFYLWFGLLHACEFMFPSPDHSSEMRSMEENWKRRWFMLLEANSLWHSWPSCVSSR